MQTIAVTIAEATKANAQSSTSGRSSLERLLNAISLHFASSVQESRIARSHFIEPDNIAESAEGKRGKYPLGVRQPPPPIETLDSFSRRLKGPVSQPVASIRRLHPSIRFEQRSPGV